jgi:hypothetical protein
MSKLIAAALSGALLVTLAAPALAQTPTAAPATTTGKLSTNSGIKDLLANPKAKDVLNKYAAPVVEFLASPDAAAMVPGETPLAMIAQNEQAQAGGLTPENMKLIEAELAGL